MNKRIVCLLTMLGIFLLPVLSYAQNPITVTGVVSDGQRQPIIGASVMLKGAKTGAATDMDGRYSITVPDNAVLEFSYLGMVTQSVPVGGRKTINVLLEEDVNYLDAAIFVGYGTQKKGSLTGSVVAVSGDDMVRTKNENPQNMLTGRVPGVRIWQKTAEPGQYNSSLDIRGFGTPLVIIDGVERGMSDFQRLSPSDIENVSVLKDAAAAIYGLKGGDGVVLVTTKSGSAGKTRVTYDGNFTFQTPASLPRQMDALSSMLLVNERSMGGVEGGAPEFPEEKIAPYRDGRAKGTDWNSLIIQDMAPQTRHDLSISGGSDKIQFYVGLGYFFQEGFWKSGDTKYDKFNLRSNITAQIANGLKFRLNLSGYSELLKNPLDDPELIIRYWWKQSTVWDAYADPAQTMLNYQDLELEWNSVARIYTDISGHRKNDRKSFNIAPSLTYDFEAITPALQGLSAKVLFSYDYRISQDERYRKEYYQYAYNPLTQTYESKLYAASSPSQLTRTDTVNYSWLLQSLLQYDRTFSKHHVGAMVGWEIQKKFADGWRGWGDLAFASPYFKALSVDNHNLAQTTLTEYAYESLIGRLNYNFDERYLIEGQFRYDGSSRFAPGHKWGFFPSVSAGWRISQEPWFKSSPLSFINQLKLRASYGILGADGSTYEWITGYTYPAATLSDNGYYTSNAPIYYLGSWVMRADPKALANENVTWYRNYTFNAGIDFEAWQGLFGFSFDYFYRYRWGLLGQNTGDFPTIVGATPPLENLNSDCHFGFELELSHRHRIGQFRYQAKMMMSITRNKRLYWYNTTHYANSYDAWRNDANNQRYQGLKFGYEVIGQYQSWEDIWTYDINKGNGVRPGDFKYLDWNGDGTIDGQDAHPYSYQGTPWMNFSLSLDGSWRNLDFSILLQGAALGSVKFGEPQLSIWGQHGGGMLEQFADRWHPSVVTNDVYDQTLTWIPGTYAYGGNSPDENSDFNVQPIDYLRLKAIEIGYTLPKISALKDLTLRIYANAYNPFTITGVKYIDPEHPADSYGRLYPLNKSYTIGLNISF